MRNFTKYLEIKSCLDAISVQDTDRIKIRNQWKNDTSSNLKKLSKYTQENIFQTNAKEIKKQEDILFKMKFTIIIFMFISGFLLGYGLLNYNIAEQINVTSFFITLILLPFSMFLIALYTMILLS